MCRLHLKHGFVHRMQLILCLCLGSETFVYVRRVFLFIREQACFLSFVAIKYHYCFCRHIRTGFAGRSFFFISLNVAANTLQLSSFYFTIYFNTSFDCCRFMVCIRIAYPKYAVFFYIHLNTKIRKI